MKKYKTICLSILLGGFIGILFLSRPVFVVAQPPPDPPDLWVNFEQDPLFSEANFLPNDTITRWVQVGNFSGQTQRIAIEAINVSDPNNFGDVLNLQIKEEGNVLFNSTLSQFFANGETYLSDLADGQTTQYDFLVTFLPEAGNDYQGVSLGFDLIVGFQGTEGGESTGGGGGAGGGASLPSGLTIRSETVTAIVDETSVTITWLTSYESTSQVIYSAEGEPHTLDLSKPYYGYAHAAPDPEDSNKVTSHSVTITGLSPGTRYYYRCVSHASPPTISQEYTFTTKGKKPKPEEKVQPEEIELPGEGGKIGEEKEETAFLPVAPSGPEEIITEQVVPSEGVEEGVEEGESIPGEEIPAEKTPIKLTAGMNVFLGASIGDIWKIIASSTPKLLIFILCLAVLAGILGKNIYFGIKSRKKKFQ